jgi:hypothetical protein
MNYISDLKNLLQFILSQAIDVTSAEKGSLMLYDLETDQLNIRVLAGMEDTSFQEKSIIMRSRAAVSSRVKVSPAGFI